MGGCMSLNGGPAGAGRDLGHGGFAIRSPPPQPQQVAVFPELDGDEPIVKQVLPDPRRRSLSALRTDCGSADSPLKAKHGAGADHSGLQQGKPLSSPPFVSAVRSASAREHRVGDRFGWQQQQEEEQEQPEMMKTTWGRSQGKIGRARSLKDPAPADHNNKQQEQGKLAAPGKETLENPLVSLECFIFL